MDVFSDLDIGSPVTSTVVTASDLTSTVENALQFDEGQNDFNMAFFDVTPYRKEGYEDSQPLVYETSTSADSVFPGLPPYPSGERVDSGVISPPAVVSSGMSSQSSMSSTSLYRQPHSTYQRSMSTFSMIESKKRSAESSAQRGHKRSSSSDEQFAAADSNSNTPSKSFVACKVCGDKASGYHYGVTSCEGCKGFFRRSIQKQIDYKCLRDKQCLVIRLNRNRCQYCRFRKCLDVGMSKDSVRYGRVPKRSREKSEENQVTQSEVEQPTQTYEFKQIMYDIILSVSEAHRANCAYTEEKTRGLVRKPALFNDVFYLTNEYSKMMINDSNSISDYQHNAVDGQIGASSLELQKIIMWQQFAALLTPSIQQIVEFAKRIPGFQELTQDDKLLCIKLGFFEVWLVHAARLINPLDGTITFSDGSFISRQQMEIMFDQEFVNLLFNFVCWFNNLQLNDSEIALYSAIVLVTAERDGIYDHKAIQQRQQQLIEAMKYQLNKDRSNEPHIFLTLVSKLPELRTLGEKHLEHLRWFRANWTHLKLSPLFAEVFDIPKAESDLAQR